MIHACSEPDTAPERAAMAVMLPDLPTSVALAGTVHRAEVGGNVCFNTVISIAIIYGG